MKLPRVLNSPLAATAGVLVGLSLLAIPLRQLTSAPPVTPVEISTPADTDHTPAWITLKLLEPAESASLSIPSGETLWSIKSATTGDHEVRLGLPIDHGALELILEVTRQTDSKETAAFLTIAPDGLKQQAHHAIGSGSLLELMEFTWPQP